MNNYTGLEKNVYQFNCIFKIIAILIMITFLITGNAKLVKAEILLTQDEQDYIAEDNVIMAASIDGGAPLHYIDSKGEIKGIAVSVLKEIADMTGLIFEYRLYPSIEDAFSSDADIFFGLARKYTPAGMVLSQPYLKSETVLFYNSSLDSNELEDKRYADIEGGDLPEGVKEENTIYYNNREDTLSAVNSGQADYSYGNAYSVAFYQLQNGYKNIVTIPKGKETREYCIGFAHENATLLSIINKSIEAIEEQRMQSIILDIASGIDRKITPAMVLETYTKEVFLVVLQVVAVLLFLIILSINSNKRLELQNKRYENLSKMSNEYLFEYSTKTNELMFSEKSVSLLGIEKQSDNVKKELRDVLFDRRKEGTVSTVKLPLANGEIGVFRIIKSNVYDTKKRLHSIIGKLVDISKETAEKEKLITMSQLDGLTGLYNSITTKELITKRIKSKIEREIDALIIIDCDGFKAINDKFGHLEGDKVLKNISNALRAAFRETDIIGRIGGDEFTVYLKNVPSADFVKSKSEEIIAAIKEMSKEFPVSVSAGVAFLKTEKTYKEIFKEADDALYRAKQKGRSEVVLGNQGWVVTG